MHVIDRICFLVECMPGAECRQKDYVVAESENNNKFTYYRYAQWGRFLLFYLRRELHYEG